MTKEERARAECEYQIDNNMTVDEQFDALPDDVKEQWDKDWIDSLDDDAKYEALHLLADYDDKRLGDVKLKLANSREEFRREKLEAREHIDAMIDNLIGWMGV